LNFLKYTEKSLIVFLVGGLRSNRHGNIHVELAHLVDKRPIRQLLAGPVHCPGAVKLNSKTRYFS
jgi:hypothetical protein